MTDEAMAAIERAVATVSDPADDAQVAAAVRAISPALIDDVVFGVASGSHGAAADGVLLGVGVAAAPGVGIGRAVFDAAAALDAFAAGHGVVLVLDETGPGDEPAMRVASGIVTRRGGTASHAAIIARQWGVPAVCGVGAIDVEGSAELLVDGGTGEVRRLDTPPTVPPGHVGPLEELPPAVATLLGWADRLAGPRLRVLANADLPADALLALDMGAQGVGLCRTEHQFLGDRTPTVVAALAGDAAAMALLVDAQRQDLVGVLEIVSPLPVTIRLLDAPRREFDPTHDEHDPMIGLRGVRAALARPGLYEAQAEAIAHAVADVILDPAGEAPDVSVLIPMVSAAPELEWARSVVADACFRVGLERGVELDVPVGVMIETPRAALCADALARHASCFSFGTNDLTQLTWGWSRDDLDAALLADYRERGIIDRSPFETLDGSGVVRLMALAVETGRGRRPDLGLTLCGEHGGDPASIAVAVQLGIDSVSVSPYRLPAARLAAAHAVLGPASTPEDGNG